MDSVLTCMVSDQLGPGVRLDEFTSEVARLLSGASCVALREYERAIELTFDALGLEAGDSIILSPLAPAVYADVLKERGIIPLFCDVDMATANLDLDAAERMIERLEARFSDAGSASSPGVPKSGGHAGDATGDGAGNAPGDGTGDTPENTPAGGEVSGHTSGQTEETAYGADEINGDGYPAEARITRMPKAVLLDSPLGAPYSANRLETLELPVIEDASHGLGAGEDGHTTGTLGKFTILSLEPESIFTTGGGAAVVARGRSEKTALKKAAESLRTTSLLPDMNASLGLAQIRALGTYIERRREVADVFRRSVMQGRHKALASGETAVPFAFPVMLDGAAKDVISYARKKDVEAVWAFSETIMAVADYWDECPSERFPAASALLLRCLLFPLYPTLTKADIERISKVLTTLP